MSTDLFGLAYRGAQRFANASLGERNRGSDTAAVGLVLTFLVETPLLSDKFAWDRGVLVSPAFDKLYVEGQSRVG